MLHEIIEQVFVNVAKRYELEWQSLLPYNTRRKGFKFEQGRQGRMICILLIYEYMNAYYVKEIFGFTKATTRQQLSRCRKMYKNSSMFRSIFRSVKSSVNQHFHSQHQ